MRRPLLIASLLAGALLLTPPGADARRDGSYERARATGICGGSARAEMELRLDEGAIEAELEVRHAGRGSAWRAVVVQERRVVWRGTVRARGGAGSFTVRRRLRDFPGADRITIRATTPGGPSCRAAATLPGS